VRRTLVTGGAGGIGLHLARRLLDDGHDVRVLDDFSSAPRDEAVTSLERHAAARVLECDLTTVDPAQIASEPLDTVYHLAALVGVARTRRHPNEVLARNVAMTAAAIEIARRARAKRFVFASSSEVYVGSLRAGILPLPTPETAALAVPDLAVARHAYMLSKLCGESLTRHSGMAWTILRYHNVYGPRMGHAHVVPELIERMLASPHETPAVRSAEHRRTFCFVSDAVEFTVRAGDSAECEGEVLNVGSPAPEIAIGELARRILRALGREPRIVSEPDAADDPERRCPDMTKTERLTGHEVQVGLDEGLAITTAWHREVRHG
jgi:nucleoside-diphosphate-sugar epimerase